MQEVKRNGILYAVIIELSNLEKGVKWYGTREDHIQVGSRKYRGGKGKILQAHIHEPAVREIRRTQEAVILVEGKLTATIYDEQGKRLQEYNMREGDSIVFYAGGHGFKIYSDRCTVYEIKSGSYINDVKEIENG